MAKVFGPLHSDDARGKLASSMVFMGWKGIKTVRGYVTPANPQTAAQGNVRTVIAGVGRGAGKVTVAGAYNTQLTDLELIPDRQSKQSWLVQQIKDLYFAGSGATLTAKYIAQLAEVTGVTLYPEWQALAVTLGVADFNLDYDTIDPFEGAMGLYLLAKVAIAKGFTGAPYDVTLTSWTATQLALFTDDL